MKNTLNHKQGCSDSSPAGFIKLNLFYRLPLAGVCLFIFWQSSFPSFDTPSLFSHQDKIIHMLVYGTLAFLAARNLKRERPKFSSGRLFVFALVFAVLYGLSDEIHQAFVPGRTASFWDLLADAAGGAMGAWFFVRFFPPGK